jgi:hypothetical protein
MILKKVSFYYKSEGWKTICCNTTSIGRTCKICKTKPKEIVYPMEGKLVGQKSFEYLNTDEAIEISFYISSIKILQNELDFSWGEVERIYFIFDKKTGEVNINGTGLGGSSIQKNRNNFYKVFEHLLFTRENLMKWTVREMFRVRGIKYNKSRKMLKDIENFRNMFYLLNAPELENTHFKIFPLLSEDQKQNIKGMNKGKKILQALIGHQSKTIVSKCQTPEEFYFLSGFGPYFKQPENLTNVMKGFENSDKSFLNDERLDQFHVAMKLLSTFHSNETVFANRLIKLSEKKGSLKNFMSYISDIGKLYSGIMDSAPDYIASFSGNIGEFHDNLSVDHRRLVKHSKLPFKYKEDIKNLEAEIDEYHFKLAKNASELSSVGSRMGICVGSYAEDVKKGYCTIILMQMENDTKVCIEIRNKSIVQAKEARNNIPREGYQKLVYEWAKVNHLKIRTSDLNVEIRQVG